MKYHTNIDTIGIQIDASTIEEQNMIRFMLCRAIQEHNNVYIKWNKFLREEEILFNSSKIGSIKLGIIPLVDSYTKLRYLKYPKPIILTDLSVAFPSEGLSIDGETAQSNCELNESLHREILDRAVELALRDYKPQNLESKIQLDMRNE